MNINCIIGLILLAWLFFCVIEEKRLQIACKCERFDGHLEEKEVYLEPHVDNPNPIIIFKAFVFPTLTFATKILRKGHEGTYDVSCQRAFF